MSRASEWAKVQPKGIESEIWSASVTNVGGLSIRIIPIRQGVEMSPKDAVALAHWIIETFEEAP